jgi:hypothetical protein
MTDRKYRSLARYTFKVAKELGLGHLDLELHSAGPNAHGLGSQRAAGEYEGIYGRNAGIIRVTKDFDCIPPEEQRVTIVHELIHAHTAQVRDFVHRSVAGVMTEAAFDIFQIAYRQQDELFTETLAQALAPKVPLWEG